MHLTWTTPPRRSVALIAACAGLSLLLCCAEVLRPVRAAEGPSLPGRSAEYFRVLAAKDVSAAYKALGVKPSQLYALPGRPASKAVGGLWSYYFAGAFTLSAYHRSKEPLLAYYNPLAGVILFTQWARDAQGRWRPIRTTAKSDRAFLLRRETRPDDVPMWLEDAKRMPSPLAVQRAGAAVIAAFTARHPVAGTRPPRIAPKSQAIALELAEATCIQLLSWIQEARSSTGKGASVWAAAGTLESLIRGQDRAALVKLLPSDHEPDAQRSGLFGLSPEACGGFRRWAVIPHGATSVVLFVHPGMALGSYAAHFDVRQDASARVTQVIYLEYNHAYARKP